MVPFLLWKSAYIKFSTRADILSCKMIMENDITILFSDLVSLIVPLQTWNEKYYKYAIIKNGLKSLVKERGSGMVYSADSFLTPTGFCR